MESHVVYSKQIFKAGKLIYTTAATVKPDQQLEDLPFVAVSDGAIPFNGINLTLSGDILVRARHLTSDNKRVSMFRWVQWLDGPKNRNWRIDPNSFFYSCESLFLLLIRFNFVVIIKG